MTSDEETAASPTLESKPTSEILSGKRERKKAEFFKPEERKQADFVIKPGNGTKLGEIPNVHFKLGKCKPDDDVLVSLHNLLYKRAGTVTKRKKDIFEFSGFVYENDDGKEKEKNVEKVMKMTLDTIHKMLDAFDLPRGSGDEAKKESKANRLVTFLDAPKQLSTVDLAAKHSAKKTQKKKGRSKTAKTPKGEKTPKKRKTEGSVKKSAKKQKIEESDDEDDDEDMDDPDEEEDVEPEEPEPQKSKQKSSAKAKEPKATTPRSTPQKAKGKKATPMAKEPEPEKDAAMDESAEDDTHVEPPDVPSIDDVDKEIEEILKGVDVNAFSLKQLMIQLEEKHGVSLKVLKKQIKERAIRYCQAKTPASQGDDQQDSSAKEDGDPKEEAKEVEGTGAEEDNKKQEEEEEEQEAKAEAKDEAAEDE